MTGVDGLVFAVVAVAAFVQAATGVGFALIVVPVAAFLRPDLLPGALILLMIPLNAWMAWSEREAVDRLGVRWITAGRVIGAIVGLGVLFVVSARGLNLLIGGSTIFAVALSLLTPQFRPGRGAFAAAGLVTGVTETATGIGGPPLALVLQHHAPATLRANVALCFLIGEVLSAVLLVIAGSLGLDQVRAAFLLVPAGAAGVLFGIRARPFVDPRALRGIVLGFALVSSLLILVKA